jgi:hypothetical protein
MLQAQLQLGGVTEDISWLVQNVPQYTGELVAIVKKGATYLPQIETIVNKAAAQIPNIAKIVDKGAKYIPTLLTIVEDPALPDVIARIQTLHTIAETEKKAAGAAATSSAPAGSALSKLLAPLDVYVWYRSHPWAARALVAGGVVAVAGAGFALGRWSKSRR